MRSKTEKFVEHGEHKLLLSFIIYNDVTAIQYTFFKDKIFIKRDEIERRNYAVTSTCARHLSFLKKKGKKRKRNHIRVVTRNNPQITKSKAFCRKMKNSVAF